MELYVPHDRHIEGIRVKLRAVQSVAILPDQQDMMAFSGATPISWEDSVLMEKIVEIGVPPKRSHATVPGDDNISSSERRGRSRISRNATPSNSRPPSPRRSMEEQLGAPPIYEEREGDGHEGHRHEAPQGGSGSASASGSGGGGLGAVMRAISRGRPSSRSESRGGSRGNSRAASRNPSPARENRDNGRDSGLSTAQPSPRRQGSTPLADTPPSLSRANSEDLIGSEANAEVVTLTGHFSRTGLSLGRAEASGPHPHQSDQDDHFGVGPSASSVNGVSIGSRGRDDRSNALASQSSAAARAATLSPSRGLAWRPREESRTRLGLGRKSVRAPSADTGAQRAASLGPDDGTGLTLQKGIHGFEFAFILPADSAPYERSPFGRVRYVVKATAFGAGRAKSNLETWQDMFPVVNPSADGGPMPLTVLYNDLHSTVGLLSVACTSNNISVGGIFNVDIHSPTPPHDLVVYLVRVSVETTTELRTRKKGKQYVPTQRHKLFEKGWVPPRPNDPHGHGDGKKSEGLIRDPTRPGSRADDAWTVQGIARMPNDNIVRSTTHERTRASIRFSHQLLVEVVHSREPEEPNKERKLKVFALRQPITLPSCCVAYDAVTLPPYTANDDSCRSANMPYDVGQMTDGMQHTSHSADSDGHLTPGTGAGQANGTGVSGARSATRPSPDRRRTNTAARLTGPGHELCVCGQSFADLSERERSLIPVRPVGELPLDGLSHRKIGELPPRGGGSNGDGAGFGSALRRTASRSSSTSRDSRGERRAASIGHRSMSIARSLSRARSPSVGSTASSRGRRQSSAQRSGSGAGSGDGGMASSARNSETQRIGGMPLPGTGERGEGVIRTTRQRSRSNHEAPVAVPPSTSSPTPTLAAAAAQGPPSYAHTVVEEEADGHGAPAND